MILLRVKPFFVHSGTALGIDNPGLYGTLAGDLGASGGSFCTQWCSGIVIVWYRCPWLHPYAHFVALCIVDWCC